MSVDCKHGKAMEEENRIESSKQQQVKDKLAFTKIKKLLLNPLDEGDYLSWQEVKLVL